MGRSYSKLMIWNENAWHGKMAREVPADRLGAPRSACGLFQHDAGKKDHFERAHLRHWAPSARIDSRA